MSNSYSLNVLLSFTLSSRFFFPHVSASSHSECCRQRVKNRQRTLNTSHQFSGFCRTAEFKELFFVCKSLKFLGSRYIFSCHLPFELSLPFRSSGSNLFTIPKSKVKTEKHLTLSSFKSRLDMFIFLPLCNCDRKRQQEMKSGDFTKDTGMRSASGERVNPGNYITPSLCPFPSLSAFLLRPSISSHLSLTIFSLSILSSLSSLQSPPSPALLPPSPCAQPLH